jgi:DNA-binding CsgD family transcriptional regulator
MSWFNDLQRVSSSGENAALVLVVQANIDVLSILGHIDIPTLVLHAKGDRQVPYEQGRQLASLIRGARFVGLDGSNHLLLRTEPAWPVAIKEIHAFLGAAQLGMHDVEESDPPDAVVQAPIPADHTARESEVLQLIAAGLTNRDIAADLFITTNTVANHVKNILSKTESSNRAEAAAFAVRHGLN